LNPAEVYDGDTSAYRRKKIRESHSEYNLTNPDMLPPRVKCVPCKMEGIPSKGLRYVVIDEIHTYRGVFARMWPMC